MASLPSLLSKHFICAGRRSLQLSTFSSLASSQSWSEEWRSLGLGARLPKPKSKMTNLLFVQMGFGVDQHGNDGSGGSGGGATKAAVRAVRNAIEFNSIPGAIEAIPGGRSEMLIKVKLGIPLKREEDSSEPCEGLPLRTIATN